MKEEEKRRMKEEEENRRMKELLEVLATDKAEGGR